jgi:hypothetical protein
MIKIMEIIESINIKVNNNNISQLKENNKLIILYWIVQKFHQILMKIRKFFKKRKMKIKYQMYKYQNKKNKNKN